MENASHPSVRAQIYRRKNPEKRDKTTLYLSFISCSDFSSTRCGLTVAASGACEFHHIFETNR